MKKSNLIGLGHAGCNCLLVITSRVIRLFYRRDNLPSRSFRHYPLRLTRNGRISKQSSGPESSAQPRSDAIYASGFGMSGVWKIGPLA
jgi:hypothetical protein